MAAKYVVLLTDKGVEALAAATATGAKIAFTEMAVGDGAGVLPIPDPAQSALVNETFRAPLTKLSIDPNAIGQIIAETVIPDTEGGWWVREMGLYDDKGTLVAIGNCPEFYKPVLQEGAARTPTVRIMLKVGNADVINLELDPNVVMATREFVEGATVGVMDGLATPEGPKFIGRCPTINEARRISPSIHGQKIDVVSYDKDSIQGGGHLYYDQHDTTSEDDGIVCFVTDDGKRIKRNLFGEIPIQWAGMGENDWVDALQRCINYLVNMAIENNSYIGLPVITIPAGRWKMNGKTVKTAPFIKLKTLGYTIFDATDGDYDAFDCSNDWPGLSNTDLDTAPAAGAYFIDGDDGFIVIAGPGADKSTKAGVIMGNTLKASLPFREAKTRNTMVTGFIAGHRWRSKRTYLCAHYDTRLEKNKHSILVDDTSAMDSGERITYYNLTSGDVNDSHIFHNCSAMDFVFEGGSFDFSKERVIRFGPSGAYADIKFNGTHIEHWDDLLVWQTKQIEGAGPNRVYFNNVKFVPRNKTYNALRPIAGGLSVIYVILNDCNLKFEKPNYLPHGSLVDYNDVYSNNNVRMTIISHSDSPEYLSSYAAALNPFRLSGVDGTDITSGTDSSIGLRFVSLNGVSVNYATVDGETVLEINSPSSEGSLSMYYTDDVAASCLEVFYAMCSVRAESAVGNLYVSGLVNSYNRTGQQIGVSADAKEDMLPYFTAAGSPVSGMARFIATPPLPGKPFRKSFYCNPGIRFSGFTGKIFVKMPAWWKKKG